MARKKSAPKASGSDARLRGQVNSKGWIPSPKQLEWYRLWTEQMMGPQAIGNQSTPKVSRQTVWAALQKTSGYFRSLNLDRIMVYRERQTEQLEMIAAKAYCKYLDSIGEAVVFTLIEGPEGNTKKTQTMVNHGDVASLRAAMQALKDIRELWGMNMPIKQEVTMHPQEIEGLPGLQGFGSRSAALRAAAEAINKTADAYAQMDSPIKR